MMASLRRTFPRSRLVWRTLHHVQTHGADPRVVDAMNDAVRRRANIVGFDMWEVGRMLELLPLSTHANIDSVTGKMTRLRLLGVRFDNRHLSFLVDLALSSVLLNFVAREAWRSGHPHAHPAIYPRSVIWPR